MSIKHLTQRGDTIVEVLICMAIVGLALGSAYSISSRSLSAVREAEERGQAVRIAQEQVERLRYLKQTNPALINSKGPGSGFKIESDMSLQTVSGAPDCRIATAGDHTAVIAVDFVVPNQYHIASGFCLPGSLGAGGEKNFDVVTFTVRVD